MPAAKDLTGKRFGYLVALRSVGSRIGRDGRPKGRLWECNCDCGRTTLVVAGSLISAATRSCGKCDARRLMHKEMVGLKLAGRIYGRWTVLREGPTRFWPSAKKWKSGAMTRRWWCRCECGREVLVLQSSLRNGDSAQCRTCADQRRSPGGVGHSSWKGGRIRTSQGYIRTWTPSHPNADTSKYVLEHRLVIERMIGRYLLAHETVHHRNGIKDDNRPGNLELMSNSHPAGQRVKDKLAHARETIALYGDCEMAQA